MGCMPRDVHLWDAQTYACEMHVHDIHAYVPSLRGVHLIGMYFTAVHLVGVHVADVQLVGGLTSSTSYNRPTSPLLMSLHPHHRLWTFLS
jgi:hypothetical protein